MSKLNLRQIRRARNITQETLANMLGVTQGVISAWENGLYYPTMSNLQVLREVLGCSLDDLIVRDTDKK